MNIKDAALTDDEKANILLKTWKFNITPSKPEFLEAITALTEGQLRKAASVFIKHVRGMADEIPPELDKHPWLSCRIIADRLEERFRAAGIELWPQEVETP